MPFPRDELVAFLVAVSFAAGLNVYATVATLGLLARFDVLTLPGSLEMLGNEWVIGISATLFLIEFIADKIPMFDLVWNALQTFVRVPVGALLGYAATTRPEPDVAGGRHRGRRLGRVGRARRQNRRARGSDAIARAVLEFPVEPCRRRVRDLHHVVRHAVSLSSPPRSSSSSS